MKKKEDPRIEAGMIKLITYINSLDDDGRNNFQNKKRLDISYIRKCASLGRPLGAHYCIEIEKATKRKVRCEHLRPDIDWAFLRRGSKI